MLGADFCSQKPIPRIEVDTATLDEFSRFYLDLDATRERARAKIQADAVVTADLLAQAEREAGAAQERYERVRRATLATTEAEGLPSWSDCPPLFGPIPIRRVGVA